MRYIIDTNVFINFIEKGYLTDDVWAILETVEGHNDPNDRLIISQAMTEKMPLISSDTKFPRYVEYGLNFISNRN